MRRRFDAVIFDFDGTLADSGPGIFAGVRHALAAMQLPPLTPAQLYTFVGPPLESSLARECGLSGDLLRQTAQKYREYYAETGMFELKLYDGVREVLDALHQRGIKIGTASSKPAYFIRQIVENQGLTDIMDAPCGADTGPMEAETDTKPRIITRAMAQLGVTDKTRALMVGDRRFDIEGAKAVGIRSAGVLYGYGSRQELVQAGADYLIAVPQELPPLVGGDAE